MSPISQATVNELIQPNPGAVTRIGTLVFDGADAAVEIVDRLEAGVDVPACGEQRNEKSR